MQQALIFCVIDKLAKWIDTICNIHYMSAPAR